MEATTTYLVWSDQPLAGADDDTLWASYSRSDQVGWSIDAHEPDPSEQQAFADELEAGP